MNLFLRFAILTCTAVSFIQCGQSLSLVSENDTNAAGSGATIPNIAAAGSQTQNALALTWNPPQTYAIIITLLEWRDPSLASFPKAGRKDLPFRDTLVARGVKPENILLLADNNATATNIRSETLKLLSRIPAGSTLLFYYAGHGIKDGQFYFANYDIDLSSTSSMVRTGISGKEIIDMVSANFKGDKFILFADCCYSGSLSELMKSSPSRAKFASLVSVDPSNVSTGNWTFTETITAMFQGDAKLDLNKDGAVTYSEANKSVQQIMKNLEHQDSFGNWDIASQPDIQFARTGTAI